MSPDLCKVIGSLWRYGSFQVGYSIVVDLCKVIASLSNYGGPLAEKVISKDPVFMGLLLDPLPKRDKNFLQVIAVYPVRVFHGFVLCFLAC